MTLSDLLTAYADGGGTLTGDALRRSVQEVWPLMLTAAFAVPSLTSSSFVSLLFAVR